MPPHETRPEASPPPPSEDAAAETVPDDVSRTESGQVRLQIEPGTDRRLRKAVLVACIALLAAFVAVRAARFIEERRVERESEAAYSTPPPVDVVVARSVAAGQDLVLPGQTAAWFESTIYARVNGYVKSWLVDIGDHVKKGQPLAIIETPELDAELEAARGQLKVSEAQQRAREAERAFAETTNERWSGAPKGVVSEQERESKKADFDSASARVFAAKAQVAQDGSRVAAYNALAEFKQVRAPFDGTITQRRIDIGNLITAGSSSTTTPLYQITQDDPLRVFIDVPQSAAAELMKAGVPAQIRATGAHAGNFTGKIARTARAISVQARTMRVEVDIPNPRGELIPGMYVTVAFSLPPLGLVEVPAAALVFRAGSPQVARVDARGKVEFLDVSIARDDGNLVELGSGPTPGDRLVLNISSQIVAGQTVTVRGAALASAGQRGDGH